VSARRFGGATHRLSLSVEKCIAALDLSAAANWMRSRVEAKDSNSVISSVTSDELARDAFSEFSVHLFRNGALARILSSLSAVAARLLDGCGLSPETCPAILPLNFSASWLESLPEEVLASVCLFLPSVAVARLICVAPRLSRLNRMQGLWRALCMRERRNPARDRQSRRDWKAECAYRQELANKDIEARRQAFSAFQPLFRFRLI
jgi:hypothetical protein